jgi:hypothetical protein
MSALTTTFASSVHKDGQSYQVLAHGNSKSLVVAHQALGHGGERAVVTINVNNPSSALLNSAGRTDIRVDAGVCNHVDAAYLRFRGTVSSSSAKLAPAPKFFNRIETKANNGSGDLLQTLYSQANEYDIFNLYNREQLEQMAVRMGYDPETFLPDGRTRQSGEVFNFIIPLPNLWLVGENPSMWKNDVVIQIYGVSGIVVSGSGTITLNDLDLVLETHIPDDADGGHAQHHSEKRVRRFLEAVYVNENTKTLTASTETKVDLSNFVGHSPFMIFGIKNATAPTNSSNVDNLFLDLGDLARIDIKDQANASQYGQGSAPYEYFLQEYLYPKLFPGVLNRRGCVVVPFSNNGADSYRGMVNGFHSFLGDRQYLSITPDAAGQAEIHSVDHSATLTAGFVTINVHTDFGSSSTGPLSYDTTAAAAKAAVDDLPICRKFGLVTTFSGALSADFTITVTTSQGHKPLNEELGLQFQVARETGLATSTEVYSVTTISQRGKRGWTNNSANSIECWAYMYKEVHYDPVSGTFRVIKNSA